MGNSNETVKLVNRNEQKKQSIDYNKILKICIIGDTGVGKTSLMSRFVDNTFKNSYIATIGMDFRFRIVRFENKQIKLQIWDCADSSLDSNTWHDTIWSPTMYCRGAHAIIIVFDISNRNSFNNIPEYLHYLQTGGQKSSYYKILVGHKSDLINKRNVSLNEANILAITHKLQYIETSAKNNENVEKIFTTIVQQVCGAKSQNNPVDSNFNNDHLSHSQATFRHLRTLQKEEEEKKSIIKSENNINIKETIVVGKQSQIKYDKSKMKEILTDLENEIKKFKQYYSVDRIEHLSENELNEYRNISNDISIFSNEFNKHIQDISVCVLNNKSIFKPLKNLANENNYKLWNLNEIMIWIETIENGRFSKYSNILRNGFAQSQILNGKYLPDLTRNDLGAEPFNIKSFPDKRDLINHFKSLNTNQNNNDINLNCDHQEGIETAYL